MQCREAVAEDRRAEEHDGLSAVLRESGTSTLHARADDRLGCGFGDAGADGISTTLRLDVLHSAEAVLTSDVVDGLAQLLAPACRARRAEASSHRAQDLRGPVALALDRLAPGRCVDMGVAAAGVPDRLSRVLHVLCDVERVDELHAITRALGRQSTVDAVEGLPLWLGSLARPHDVQGRALSPHRFQ